MGIFEVIKVRAKWDPGEGVMVKVSVGPQVAENITTKQRCRASIV